MSDFFEHSTSSHPRCVFCQNEEIFQNFLSTVNFFIRGIDFFRTEHYKFLYMKKSDMCL